VFEGVALVAIYVVLAAFTLYDWSRANGPLPAGRSIPGVRAADRSERQYQRPRAKPPKAISPINAMIRPIQKLQTIIRTIPRMTRIPPTEIPPMPPLRGSAAISPPCREQDGR
jgi:hypothetical protein